MARIRGATIPIFRLSDERVDENNKIPPEVIRANSADDDATQSPTYAQGLIDPLPRLRTAVKSRRSDRSDRRRKGEARLFGTCWARKQHRHRKRSADRIIKGKIRRASYGSLIAKGGARQGTHAAWLAAATA
jgi:hypothetical protein